MLACVLTLACFKGCFQGAFQLQSWLVVRAVFVEPRLLVSECEDPGLVSAWAQVSFLEQFMKLIRAQDPERFSV